MSHPDWINVSRSHPCPICGRPMPRHKSRMCKWKRDGSSVICGFVPDGSKYECADGMGWIHALRDVRPIRRRKPRRSRPKPSPDFGALADTCRSEILYDQIDDLSYELGVSHESLVALHIGWSIRHRAYTFPMRNAWGKVIGIRLRGRAGGKWAIRGSQNGLFIPDNMNDHSDRLLIVEGPTDAAAMLDIGMTVIGRPSARSGLFHIRRFAQRCRFNEIVILSDSDEPDRQGRRAGREGAEATADALKDDGIRCVKVIEPLWGDDARDWKQRGATRRMVKEVIVSACAWRADLFSALDARHVVT